MSSNSIISSGESEERWVHVMETNFKNFIIVDLPLHVFRVPKAVSESKPEAYAPTRLGLGPLHHLRPDLYASTNNRKLAAISKLLPPQKLYRFQEVVVEALVGLEPILRACYDQYLDLDIKTLAWIIAIDGLYLFHFLKSYPEMEHVAGDVLMLENQIPLILLNKILEVLQLGSVIVGSLREFEAFFSDQSPLELESEVELHYYVHLLHRMYYRIVNCRPRANFGDDLGAGTADQILSFMSKLPREKISAGVLKRDLSASAGKIDIPSASHMTRVAGVRFILVPGGIREVRFDDEGKKFYLPSIRITATTEIVLRNLVAYEAAAAEAAEWSAPGATFVLAEYLDLMCGIMDSPKDVVVLREAGIVRSEMADEEIARIFNAIAKIGEDEDGQTK